MLELIEVAAENGLPRLRAGVAVGSAASRAGDWFGSPVNIASRVTGVAKPGTVLAAESAREAIGAAYDLVWFPVGAHHLKGVPEQVELYRVARAGR
jgi:adenylate cyclase